MIDDVIVALILSLLSIAFVAVVTGVVGGVWALVHVSRAQADLVEEEDE